MYPTRMTTSPTSSSSSAEGQLAKVELEAFLQSPIWLWLLQELDKHSDQALRQLRTGSDLHELFRLQGKLDAYGRIQLIINDMKRKLQE